ncbi:PQQ-dependent sugar dehydrogenase [Thalassomonas sp. RHCl1]|uniref:PQQ-dependent sugar dehydrogenase n=1 Tax=Thalassomonas sp. RHCl1 TaxID=2995320 RepID=UPI00248BE297|nr:PQQ-dependent sugar dehydrogenase [Thalassomonas sp. RHCl1]
MKKSLIACMLLACQSAAAITLDQLSVPSGFKISFFAEDVGSARQMALSDSGVVYAGSMNAGKVYALKDTDNDGKADKRWLIAKGLKRPSGIAFKDGDLYVADIERILRFGNIDANLEKPKSEVFFSDLPDDRHHGWKFLRFAPNGDLIIPVGAPCNICEAPTDKHSRIFSLNMKTKALTEIASGVRNSVGFDFHPVSGELWFSENGGDMMGDDVPPDEINRLVKPGSHFGYPYFHAGTIADPKFGKGKKPEDYVHPVLKLGAHVAPLGIHFYQGKQYPASYKHQLFVAEHGSWNRSKKSGYKVGVVTLEGSKVIKYEPFVTGFMKNEQTFGRPAAITELDDGSLLISDDYADAIYRVTYGN